MALEKQFYINTGKDGRLGDTSRADLDAMLAVLAGQPKIVLHFHGGLVKKSAGMKTAERLTPAYQAAGAHPVFFVWESGLLETVRHNLGEINKEKIFQKLVKKLLKHAVGKLTADAGAKATRHLPYPTDIELASEMQKAQNDEEPFADLEPEPGADEVDDWERKALESELAADAEFQSEVRAIAAAALPDAEVQENGAKGVTTLTRKSTKSLMSPDVIEELEEETEAGAKGLITTAKMIYRAGRILVRVVKRHLKSRDHGLYITIVEETLREFYAANVGAEIWQMMKKETADTFDDGPGDRGGRLFVDGLGAILQGGHRPEITLVGHSTGAVFILNLLRDVKLRAADPTHPWPADFTFENVLFLAPACDFDTFQTALDQYSHLFRNFRMFTMRDDLEKGKPLVPIVYPRSLLYFISGVVEKQPDGESAFDRPILGMERYFTMTGTYKQQSIAAARKFIADDDKRVVWSLSDREPGLRSNSDTHGGFDDFDPADPAGFTTMASVQYVIANGA
jgi:hypothetical protein